MSFLGVGGGYLGRTKVFYPIQGQSGTLVGFRGGAGRAAWLVLNERGWRVSPLTVGKGQARFFA